MHGMTRPKLLILDAGRVRLVEAASLPLYIAAHFPANVDAVVTMARLREDGVSAGSLQAVWSNESAVRRASGGLKFNVRTGDYHLSIVFREGTLRYINIKYMHIIDRYGGDVEIGLGKTANHPFIEVYSRNDPTSMVDEFFPNASVISEDEMDVELLDSVVRTLTEPSWTDPIDASKELISYRVSNGKYYIGIIGVAFDGLIKATWPDSNIHVYPAGIARGIFKEISEVPPSLPLAFHAAKGFMSGVEYVGVEPEHILEAFRGYILEAEKIAGEP